MDQISNLRPYKLTRLSKFHIPAIIYLSVISFLFINNTGFPQNQNSKNTIKIGFLIRDNNDLAVKQSAELAIEHANARSGNQGKSFELITKSCDGPWGIGSKQAVSLVYNDGVSLIVAALDGRNAHLAEQVIAKSQVVMLSTLSSDPTLSRAYVPWYFRIVPHDRQQAKVLVQEIYLEQKFTKVALVSMDNYDGKMSAESMVIETEERGFEIPQTFNDTDFKELLKKSTQYQWDAIVLAGISKNVFEIIGDIIAANSKAKVYAFLNVFNFLNNYQNQDLENVVYISQLGIKNSKWRNFEKSYQTKYGTSPIPSLAFVYDGIMLSIEAIKKYGPDPDIIRKGFQFMEIEGLTGEIKFDKFGDRKGESRLIQIK